MASPEESEAIKTLKGALGLSGYARPSDRDMALFGYDPETKRAIVRAIELSPALEEAILNIAELAFRDGMDSVTDML
jgi:hypothetical protein